ncbi:MAG: outer membrane beta-barrel protein [Acidobacteriaceae bacterium]
MKTGFRALALLCVSFVACGVLHAQAFPAATRLFTFSAFGAATGTYTGLDGGKNLGITAGVDMNFKPYHLFYPSAEVRGTYPIDDGQVAAERNVLFGPRIERYYGIFRPYVDFLYGRARIDYQNGGLPNPAGTLLYIDSVSNVFGVGGGVNLTLTDHLALKIDGQFQHYAVPVTTSGSIYSEPISVGVVYRFGSPPLKP